MKHSRKNSPRRPADLTGQHLAENAPEWARRSQGVGVAVHRAKPLGETKCPPRAVVHVEPSSEITGRHDSWKVNEEHMDTGNRRPAVLIKSSGYALIYASIYVASSGKA